MVFAFNTDVSVHCLHTVPEVGFENDVQNFGCLRTQFLTMNDLTTENLILAVNKISGNK